MAANEPVEKVRRAAVMTDEHGCRIGTLRIS